MIKNSLEIFIWFYQYTEALHIFHNSKTPLVYVERFGKEIRKMCEDLIETDPLISNNSVTFYVCNVEKDLTVKIVKS